MDTSARILLIDDHRILREGLKALVARESDMRVIAEAENGRAGLALVEELSPDVVLMDISMPGLNGIDATRQVLAACPTAKVIALTAYDSRNLVTEMLRAGASGYVLKDVAFEELITALKTVLAGRVYLSPRIAALVVEGLVDGGEPEPEKGVFARLTAREREVLQLMAEGKATKEVAMAMHLSVKTVETHRRAIMEKLSLYSVAELTKYAIREGLTTLEH